MGRGLKLIGFDGVSAFRDRHGKTRYRFRRKGSRTVYLPGLPGSAEFAEGYRLALDGVTSKIVVGASRTVPGSISALVVGVYASAEWSLLSEQTRVTYRGIMERIRRDHGHLIVRGLLKRHVLTMRDKKKETPAAANNFVKVLRWMLNFAVERSWRDDNPCIGIKPLKYDSDGFKTWSEAEARQFEERWPIGSRQRTAYALLLGTVQRSGDVRQMGRQNEKAGRLDFRQHKTGTELSLPVVPSLQESLDTVSDNQMLYIVTQFGAGYTAKGFGNWFSRSARQAGLVGCTAHGLRKLGATRLANKGKSESVIMAWTGHQTPKEVQRYTKARDQRLLADAGTEDEQTLANPKNRLANAPSKALK